jgi:Fic family protein
MAKNKGPSDLPKLPAQINYNDLVDQITKAHSSLARLDEMLRHIPNPSLIEQTFLTQEAVLSSKIEGTQVTLEEVLKKEAEQGGEHVEEDSEKGRDIREVWNYRRAFRMGLDMIAEGEPLAENNVKKLHRTLLQSVRGKTRAPGEFRKGQVHIGPPGTPMEDARYVPPGAGEISDLYSNFDKYLNNPAAEKDVLVQIAVAHYQFEAIHPFMDGNGRVGRLLIPLFLFKRGVISSPLMYVSQYFEENRHDYYDLLADVSYKDAWTPWIRFFLNGLCVQAAIASEAGRAITQLRSEHQAHLSEYKSTYAYSILDAMFAQPYFTPNLISAKSGIKNKQTVLNLIEKFKAAGIVVDLIPSRKRNKVYEFKQLTDLLNASQGGKKKSV